MTVEVVSPVAEPSMVSVPSRVPALHVESDGECRKVTVPVGVKPETVSFTSAVSVTSVP